MALSLNLMEFPKKIGLKDFFEIMTKMLIVKMKLLNFK